MNYQWKHFQPTDEQAKRAEHLAGMLNLHPVIGTLLVERGVETVEEAKQFFRPQLTQLHDPFLFKDMKAAINRLNEALGRKERILVYGDYDVDGVTAVALVYKFLHQYCTNIDYYIPDRYEDGYGVSHKGVDYAHETGVKLIIVLDCGIKAVEEIAYAKSLGIDFIICDHHVPDKQLPPAAARSGRAQRQTRRSHLPLRAPVRMRCGIQVDTGLRRQQRDSLLRSHPPARPLRHQHCFGHRAHPWGEQNTRLSRPSSD